jgi:hypothetical protein
VRCCSLLHCMSLRLALRDILRRDATSVATGGIAEVGEQPPFEKTTLVTLCRHRCIAIFCINGSSESYNLRFRRSILGTPWFTFYTFLSVIKSLRASIRPQDYRAELGNECLMLRVKPT